MRLFLFIASVTVLLVTSGMAETPWCLEPVMRVEFSAEQVDLVLERLEPRFPRLTFIRSSDWSFSVEGMPNQCLAVRDELILIENSIGRPGLEVSEFLPVRPGRGADLQDLLANLVPEAHYSRSGDSTVIEITATPDILAKIGALLDAGQPHRERILTDLQADQLKLFEDVRPRGLSLISDYAESEAVNGVEVGRWDLFMPPMDICK